MFKFTLNLRKIYVRFFSHRFSKCKVRKFTTQYSQQCMKNKFKLPSKFGTGEANVWVEYNQLVAEHKPPCNLGQGFPDFHAPKHVTQALSVVALEDNPMNSQYTRGFGHPRLVNSLARLYSQLIGREIDPMNEILTGCGAYESLYCAILGHVEKGDEVIIIEPFFDSYDVVVKAAGGSCKFIPLKPKDPSKTDMTSEDWVLDKCEFASAFNVGTKMLIFNTPNNPLGKIYSQEEMEFIADLCKEHNVLCLSDEVYEWVMYPPFKHLRMASLPGMWERTITVGSAGKTFSVTGWKIGWAYGPAGLMKNLQVVHQNCVYTCCTPVQEALARAFEFELCYLGCPECYFMKLPKQILPKRDFLTKVLKDIGFKPTIPQGGYFIVADWTNLANKIDLSTEKDKRKDYKFTKKFAKESGVLAIPTTAFYSEEHKHLGENFTRFCFIKKDENLKLAEKLMTEWNAKRT